MPYARTFYIAQDRYLRGLGDEHRSLLQSFLDHTMLLPEPSEALLPGTHIGALDRSLGLLFGMARGALILAVTWLAAAWAYQEEPIPDWIAEARSLPLVQEGARALYDALPEGFRPKEVPPALESAEGLKNITFDDLDRPAPKSAVQDDQSGYNSDTRKGLDNLFQQNQ